MNENNIKTATTENNVKTADDQNNMKTVEMINLQDVAGGKLTLAEAIRFGKSVIRFIRDVRD